MSLQADLSSDDQDMASGFMDAMCNFAQVLEDRNLELDEFAEQVAAGDIDTALMEITRSQEALSLQMSKLAKMDISGFSTRALFKALTGAKELGLPADFFKGKKEYTVYIGYDKGSKKPAYVGITNDFNRRKREWAGTYEIKARHTGLTKKQAQSIEQVIKMENPHFRNMINPLSNRHRWFGKAIGWAKGFLKGKRRRF